MAKLQQFWDSLDEHAKTIVTALVAAVVLALSMFVLAPRPLPEPDPLESELKVIREENVSLREQLEEASRSLDVFRTENHVLAEELETAKKNVRVVVREVFREDGNLQERVTDTKTKTETKKATKTETKQSTASIRVVEVVKVATVSVDLHKKDFEELKVKYDSRTAFGLGTAVSPAGVSFVLTWSPYQVGPFSVDLIAGTPIPVRPLFGVGASAEVFPRFSLGAAALADPLAFSVSPGLVLTHRF